MPHLKFSEGQRDLFVHLLRPGRTVIGRSDRCDVALPSETISRVHCVIERRTEGWWLTDRSRHGTSVNGEKIDRHLLGHDDEIQIGAYSACFSLREDSKPAAPTATAPMPAAIHEELVEASSEGYATCRGQLKITRGPRSGDTILLTQARTGVGGDGSSLVLADELPANACFIRVVRGRAMVEPGRTPVFLAGTRVREITPALIGEEVRISDHGFQIDITTVEEQEKTLDGFGEMVGRSEAMRRIFAVLARTATHDAPVLLTGESGTGKELAARGIHGAGPRHDGPFVAVNCASVAESLFESELFGHVKGAFTGATNRQDGAFQQADGGTLFLDEIGELKQDVQAKLLRALESGEVKRVGGNKVEFPDVRVVAATNRHLPDMVDGGGFRADLYFRLAVLTVELPPLRQRPDDIEPIARALLERNHPGARLMDDAASALKEYEWPGNIRELRNVLTRAFVMGGEKIHAGSLTFNPWAFKGSGPRPTARVDPEEAEKKRLIAALRETGGNRTRAARSLDMPRSSLLYKMKKYKITSL